MRSEAPKMDTLEVEFSVAAHRLAEDWEKNHICAEYLADYASQVLANVKAPPALLDLCDRVNYIANELLEAAMLSQVTPTGQIWVRLQLTDKNILLNVTSDHCADRLSYLKDLAKLTDVQNPGALYLDRLRQGDVPSSTYSDIRFLSMMVDCDATIDMMIEADEKPDRTLSVTTKTSMPVS